jgi:hypothetical protein
LLYVIETNATSALFPLVVILRDGVRAWLPMRSDSTQSEALQSLRR